MGSRKPLYGMKGAGTTTVAARYVYGADPTRLTITAASSEVTVNQINHPESASG